MFSRIATGLIVGAVAGLGTSGFDAFSGFASAGFAVELVAPEGALFAEPGALAGLARAGFAGLPVALDADALAGELGAEVGAGGAGFVAALVGGTGFGACD
jgi:hypothetical protein